MKSRSYYMSGKKIWQRACYFIIFLLSINKQMISQQPDAFKKIKPISEKYQLLPFGAVKPTGWLLEQVQQNLAGFTGKLDSLVPDLITRDDIYGKNRLTPGVKSKELGALGAAGDWQVQFLWWNSETQGNWLDGYIRSAILTGDRSHLQRIKKYISHLLSTQDADGYLGIYDRSLRYKFNNENGELWSKTTLLRGLLAWYDHTKDKAVLTAIQRAVQNVMDNYRINASHPFHSIKPDVGGISHGLTFTDVLESLYRLTHHRVYLDYALFCYKDFSKQVLNEDAQYKKLLDTNLSLKGHGVHTYEHLRVVATAYYISGNPELRIALQNFLYKIDQMITPTGGPVGDEWIAAKKANATTRGYEYCSMQELLHSYADLLIKSGERDYGDKIEHLFFNAAQGSRHPEQSAIAYLKSDNSYYMTGGLNGDTTVKHQTRYKYSPVHQDAAVCCVPNAGRITPYYIQHMWLKDDDDLVASLLGPCELNAVISGKQVRVKEETGYPYTYTVNFNITADNVPFTLKIRKPAWAKRFSVSEIFTEENGYLLIKKTWKGSTNVQVVFFPEVEIKKDMNDEFYFSYGPLVLAHPLKSVPVSTKKFPLAGFNDLEYSPEKLVIYQYEKGKTEKFGDDRLLFTTPLFNATTGDTEQVELEPVGKTILRQVTFKPKSLQ